MKCLWKILAIAVVITILGYALPGPSLGWNLIRAESEPGLPDQFSIGWDPMQVTEIQPNYTLDIYGAINSAETAMALKPKITQLKTHGISYMAYFAFDHIEGDAYECFPDLSTNGVWIDLDGNDRENYMESGHYLHTIGRAAFRQYLIDAAKLVIDAGGEAACYDVAIFREDSFDPDSMTAFANYLVTNGHTISELELDTTATGAQGVNTDEDLVHFDYGEYLRYLGYSADGIDYAATGWWENPENPDYSIKHLANPMTPLIWSVWVTWHSIFLRDFVTELSATTKAYAQSQGQNFSLTFNRYGNGQRWLISDIADFECGETFIDSLYDYSHQNLAPSYKANLSHDGKRLWSWNWPTIKNGSTVTDIAGLYVAETYASGGIPQYTWSNSETDVYSAVKPYFQFAQLYHDLLGKSDTVADVALLYGQESNAGNEMSFKGAGLLLADSHIQYNVLFCADGITRADTLSASDLSHYSTAILPGVWSLTDNQVHILLEFINNGGNVIVLGNTDTRTDTADRNTWNNLVNAGTANYGSGTIFVTATDFGSDYWNAGESAARSALLGAWNAFVSGTMVSQTTTFSPEVNIFRYPATDASEIYHLVNYENISGEIITQTNKTITLTTPSAFVGRPVTVSMVSPSVTVPQILYSSDSAGSSVTVTVPTLDVWAILKIGSVITTPEAIDYVPFSTIKPELNYWKVTPDNKLKIEYRAADDKGLSSIDIYYRYRSNESASWGSWTLASTESISGSFTEGVYNLTPASGEGCYSFYVRARDNAGQQEADKAYIEAENGFDITPPPNPVFIESHGVSSNVETSITNPVFTWTQAEDSVSGLVSDADWNVYWGPPGSATLYTIPEGTTSFAPSELPSGTAMEYWLYLKVYDNAGNCNNGSSPQGNKFIYRYAPAGGSPSVTTNEATDILDTSARMNGNLNSLGTAASVNVSFQWGISSDNLDQVAVPVPSAMTSPGAFSAVVSGLVPGQTYYYRAKAEGTTTVYGGVESFVAGSHSLTIIIVGNGSTNPGPGNYYYSDGEQVQITATPGAGFHFNGWTVIGGTENSTTNTITITMNGDKTVTANFAANSFTLTIAVEGSGTTDPPAGTYNYNSGTTVYIGATPSAGWTFNGWSGDASGTSNPITIIMDENKTVTAVFVQVVALPGDANQDGIINSQDITQVEKIVAKLVDATVQADANQDGEYNALDITKTEMLVAHLD